MRAASLRGRECPPKPRQPQHPEVTPRASPFELLAPVFNSARGKHIPQININLTCTCIYDQRQWIS
jgi:hypothetical protein